MRADVIARMLLDFRHSLLEQEGETPQAQVTLTTIRLIVHGYLLNLPEQSLRRAPADLRLQRDQYVRTLLEPPAAGVSWHTQRSTVLRAMELVDLLLLT